MIAVNAQLTTSAVLAPLKAFIVYGPPSGIRDGTPTVTAMIHDIKVVENKPVIQAGEPATMEGLNALVMAMAGQQDIQLIPESILATAITQMIWWVPSVVRPIYFKPDHGNVGRAKLKAMSGKPVTHPSLLFIATPKRLKVFALANGKRPNMATPVYQVPYWNVYGNGEMCEGNVPMPSYPTVKTMPDYERAFYETNFTHGNARVKVCNHPEGHVGFWRAMRGNTLKRIPVRWLVPAMAGEVQANMKAVIEGKANQ